MNNAPQSDNDQWHLGEDGKPKFYAPKEVDFTPPETEDLCVNCGYGEWRHKDKHPCKSFDNGSSAPKPSKLDEILDLHMAFKTEQGVLYSQLSTAQAHAQILALIEEVIGPDEEDDGFYSKEYIKHVNGEKAEQRLRKDAL